MGDGADSQNIKELYHVTPAKTFDATLDKEISKKKKASTPGFCFHSNTSMLSTGCNNGDRFENRVGLSSPDLSPYLRTYRVVYIIKCWHKRI